MNLSDRTYLVAEDRRGAHPDVGAWLSRTIGVMNRIGARLAHWHTRAKQMRELYRFTDRDLWDLGLSRSDIPAIENGTYRRD